MKKPAILFVILGIVSFGIMSAAEKKRIGALPEQMDIEQARREEEMRRGERLAAFEREVDRVFEQSKREYQQQQFLENYGEGTVFK